MGLAEAMDALKEKDQVALTGLLLELHKQGLLTAEHMMEGLAAHTEDLEGLRCVPGGRGDTGWGLAG